MASRFRFLRANEILSQLTDYTLTHTTKLNDFTEGSALETIYEAFSTLLEQYYYLNVENIKTSIMDSIFASFGFFRKPELKAYGTVQLTFDSALNSDLVIASGTQFHSSNTEYTQVYETLDEYTVPAGTDTYQVTVYCTEGGTFGNVPSGVIDTTSNISNLTNVVNTEAFQTGQEAESMSEVRRRFRQFIQAIQKGSIQAIQYGAQNVPNVYSIYLDETPGYVRVYADDANGDLSNELRAQIQNELYYWRSAGVPVEVLPVHRTVADMDITLDVPDDAFRTNALKTKVGLSINNYINSLDIADSINVNHLVNKILESSSAINDVQANLKINPDASLRGNLAVTDTNSILINEHLYPKSIYQPTDRSVEEHYLVSNPEDWDSQDWDTSTTTTTTTLTTTVNPDADMPDDLFEQEALSNRIKMFINRELKGGTINLNGLTWQDISGDKDQTKPNDDSDNPIAPKTLQDLVTNLITDQVKAGNLNLNGASWNQIKGAVNFALEDDTGANDSGMIPGPNSMQKNPISLGTEGGATSFDYLMTDGSTVGFLTTDNYASMSGTRFRFKDGSRLLVNQTSSVNTLAYNYYAVGSETAENGDLTFNQDNKVHDLTVTPTATGITIKNNSSTTVSNCTYTPMAINYTDTTGNNVSVTFDIADINNMFIADVEEGNNLHFVYSFTHSGALNTFYTDFKVSNSGNEIKSYYDGSGNTLHVDTFNSTGTMITSVDGSGNNLMPPAGDATSTSTTTSTTTDDGTGDDDTDTTTTTTLTTKYPFSIIQPVSAMDAPDDGYLPVFGTYNTSSNEVLKAGTIVVTFKQSS